MLNPGEGLSPTTSAQRSFIPQASPGTQSFVRPGGTHAVVVAVGLDTQGLKGYLDSEQI